MKRYISIMCVVFFIILFSVPIAYAEQVDLSSLSYEQLMELNTEIQSEIMSRPDFKKVLVPPGAYIVGKEIPAGKWTITATEGMCEVYWGKQLDEYGVEIPYEYRIDDLDDWGNNSSITWNLIEGTFIVIERNSVTFTPAIAANLGFN